MVDCAAVDDDDRVFELSPPFGPPVFLGIGFVLVGVFAYLAYTNPVTWTLFLLGFFSMGTGIIYALSFQMEQVRKLTIHRVGLRIESVDGSAVTLPRESIDRAAAHPVESRSTTNGRTTVSVSWHVYLRKKDGGALDLGSQRDQGTAEKMAADFNTAFVRPLARGPEDGDVLALPQDPVAMLAESKGVRASREQGTPGSDDYRAAPKEGSLLVLWSRRPTHADVIPALLIPWGLAAAAYAISIGHFSKIPLYISYGLVALGVVLLVNLVRLWGLSQAVRVTAKELIVEERRGSRVKSQKAYPLSEISAVDYSQMTGREGGQLVLRMHGTKPPEAPKEPSTAALKQVLSEVADYARDTVLISMGPLKMGDKLRIDLALSAEIARRTGRNDADV